VRKRRRLTNGLASLPLDHTGDKIEGEAVLSLLGGLLSSSDCEAVQGLVIFGTLVGPCGFHGRGYKKLIIQSLGRSSQLKCVVVQKLFAEAVVAKVGDGANTLFWKDSLLDGRCIKDLAPSVADLVPIRLANRRLVKDVLPNFRWMADLHGNLSVIVIGELMDSVRFWKIWRFSPVLQTAIFGKFCASGNYSASSAYKALFQGSIGFEPAERVWKSWAPRKCKFFIWLVEHDRCWTADRLARRGLDHPDCLPLCDQDDESINHLLVSCVFSR
jgi:hypothetical protein